jgi:DNA uptake protein ComE-like DNA-binding protein
VIEKIKKKLRLFFGFSATETNGLLLLIPILIIILIFPSFLKQVLSKENPVKDKADMELLDAWYLETKAKLNSENEAIHIISTRSFNPNQLTSTEWEELGFKTYVSQRIVKYRLMGGEYKKKEDLLKISGINERLVKAYYDYMIIPKKEKRKGYYLSKKWDKKKTPSVQEKRENKTSFLPIAKKNINTASQEDLEKTHGIGPFLSSLIVKERGLLGGFIHKSQLSQIYRMDEERVNELLDNFFVPETPLIKVSINQDSIKVLLKHPYLDYRTSKAIVKYRQQHGDYRSLEELKEIYTISDSLYQKIIPYLTIKK